MVILSYGGGTNSTAMLFGMLERGERPDAILFADTGAERPETYAHVRAVDEWCGRNGFPRIETVRKGGRPETLEQNCLRMRMLPSLAYGYKGCSHKYKIEPQEKWANNDERAKAVWAQGEKVTKLIGYDADEDHRAKILETKKYFYRYPLVEWDWGREECKDAIARAGFCQPGKSACFFCPSTKPHEIRAMVETHPELIERAIAMEENAELTSVLGLGRNFAWRNLIATGDLFPEAYHGIEQPCGCYEG